MVLRSKFTDEKHLVYLRWNDRDRARHAPEMKTTIVSPERRDRGRNRRRRCVAIVDLGFSSCVSLPM